MNRLLSRVLRSRRRRDSARGRRFIEPLERRTLLSLVTTINFDGLLAGTVITNQYHGQNVDLSGQGQTQTVIANVGSGIAHSGSNVANITVPDGVEFPVPLVVGTFVHPVDDVLVYVGMIAGGSNDVTLQVYNTSSQLLGSYGPVTISGSGFGTRLHYAAATANIGSFKVSGTNANQAGIDDLGFIQPDFAIAPAGGTVTAAPGGASVTDSISITRLDGSSGNIQFGASGLPAGVTASFSPNPATGGSTVMTFTAAAGTSLIASPGASILITATPTTDRAGTVTHTSTVNVIVRPDFTMTPDNPSVGLALSATVPVTLTRAMDPPYGSAISLSVSGLPSGITASFQPATISSFDSGGATAHSTMTLTADPAVPLNDFTCTLIASSSGETSQALLVVNRLPLPDFYFSSTGDVYDYIAPSASQQFGIDIVRINGSSGNINFSITGLPTGVTGSFSPNPTSGDSGILTLMAASDAPLLDYPGALATITATPADAQAGIATHTTSWHIMVQPDFTITPDLSPAELALDATVPVTITRLHASFSGPVDLSMTGLPPGISGSFDPPQVTLSDNATTAHATLTLSADPAVPLNDFALTLLATSGGGESIPGSLPVHRLPLPDFTLTPLYDSVSVGPGGGFGVTTGLTIGRLYGSVGNFAFAFTGLPDGVTRDVWLDPQHADQLDFKFEAAADTPLGAWPVTVTAMPLDPHAGITSHQATFDLIVRPDFVLSAPAQVDLAWRTVVDLTIVRAMDWEFTQDLNLSASGLPAGITATFDPAVVTSSDFGDYNSTTSPTLVLTAPPDSFGQDFTLTLAATTALGETSAATLNVHRVTDQTVAIDFDQLDPAPWSRTSTTTSASILLARIPSRTRTPTLPW